jgi:hypothetical protein
MKVRGDTRDLQMTYSIILHAANLSSPLTFEKVRQCRAQLRELKPKPRRFRGLRHNPLTSQQHVRHFTED